MAAWQIPLAVGQGVTPVETPAQIGQAALGLRAIAQANQIRQQQTQENALKIQALQDDQNDQSTIQNAFNDRNNWTNGAPDYDKVRTAIAPQVRLRNLQAFDQDHLRMQQAATSLAMSNNYNERTQFQTTKDQNQLLGQLLSGVLEAPDEQKQDIYAGALATAKKAGIDVSGYPPDVPDDDTLKAHEAKLGYIGTLLTNADKKAQEAQRQQAAERAAAQAKLADAKTAGDLIQSELTEAARQHEGVTNQEQHDEWLNGLSDDVKPYFKNLTEFNDDTNKRIQGIATPQSQQAKVNLSSSARLDAASQHGKAGLAALANDPTADPATRQAASDALDRLSKDETKVSANQAAIQSRFDAREQDAAGKQADADSAKHQQLRQQEIDQSTLRTRLGNAITDAQAKGAKTVADPKTGKDISVADAQAMADAARDKAATLWDQQAQLRARHQWGEYAPGATGAQQNPWRTTAPSGTTGNSGGQTGKQQGAWSATGASSFNGMITPGNIDLVNRPRVNNPDGTYSTVRTITAEIDGKTVLLPTVINGKIVSNDEAIRHYKQTGEHMGIFNSEQSADAYDRELHNRMGWNGAPGSAQAKWQASAPGATPVQTGQTKQTTMAMVQAYADKYKIPVEQAKANVKSQGYQITDER